MNKILRKINFSFILLQIFILSNLVYAQPQDFTFVFATDIHIQKEKNADQGFAKAIEEINKIDPDFVLTGGDLIMDALGVSFNSADSQFNLYNKTVKLLNVPVFNTIGNHDILGWYDKSKIERDHPEFGKKIYQNRIGKLYYSFLHKGVKFIILDSVEELPEGNGYFGYVNSEQIDWLKNELSQTEKSTPIVISTHIPLLTSFSQISEGAQKANERGLVVENSKEVLDLLKEYKSALILQGHLHIFEDINIMNRFRFVTAGAVSAKWWRGPNAGMEEGFAVVKFKNEKFSVQYFDYGWEAN